MDNNECERLRRLAEDLKLGLGDIGELLDGVLADATLSRESLSQCRRAAAAARRMSDLAGIALNCAAPEAEEAED